MKFRTAAAALTAALMLAPAAPACASAASLLKGRAQVPVKTVVVRADTDWTDTGLDVKREDELTFKGKGEVSLQRGNPAAACGPDGMEILSSQQPIPDKNTGALIGKVVQLIGVRKDEETGEEVRDEIVSIFYIGREGRVFMPTAGRLFLGVNENVVKDNSGEFRVEILKPGND